MFVSHQHAMPFLRGAGGFARAVGCGNAASPGYFFMINGVAGLCCSRARAACGKRATAAARPARRPTLSKTRDVTFMRGVGQQWARRMVAFMRSTNSTAPLQWMAEQMGCDVVQRDSRAAEVAALKQRLQELERAA